MFHNPFRLPPSSGLKGRSPRNLRLLTVAAVVVLALSAVMTAAAASASISAPAAAAPGAQVAVSGQGFGAGQAGVLTYNGGQVATFTATSAGSFSAAVTIPPGAAIGSTGRISAKTNSGSLLATTTLAVGNVAAIAPPPVSGAATLVVPAYANPGTSVTVAGSGFASGSTGNLTINGCKEATFTADASGAFSVSFPIPSSTSVGTSRISAKKADGTLMATTTLAMGVGATPTPGSTPTPGATPTSGSTPTPGSTPTAGATPPPAATAPPTTGPTPPPSSIPNFSHVYVIIFENKEYSSVVGSSSAPYINSLISQYGLSTSFYAERHPSEPNYIALTSGGTQGIADDGVYNLGVNNLFDQITASGRTWKSVMQGYPGNCSTVSSSSAVTDGVGKSGAYVRKHDPAISYTSISGNSAKCANITNLASFDPAAANFQFITPNMINDMHDGTVADGDNFLKAFLPKITSSSAFANSVVYVTFDEGTTNVNGGGHIMTIAITPNMTASYKTSASYTHYSMLRTIEQAWGLPYLGGAASASSMAFPY